MKLKSWLAWLGLPVVVLIIAACAVLTGAKQADQVKYLLSPDQIKAIANANGQPVTVWVDSTLWVRVGTGEVLDESRPCPPFTGCN